MIASVHIRITRPERVNLPAGDTIECSPEHTIIDKTTCVVPRKHFIHDFHVRISMEISRRYASRVLIAITK